MPKIPYTKLYTADWLSWRRNLSPDVLCELLDCISDYCSFGKNPLDNLRDNLRDNQQVLEVVKSLLKWAQESEKAYNASVLNGKKGGRPKNPQVIPQANLNHNPPSKQTDTELKTKQILNNLFNNNTQLVVNDSFVIPVNEEPFSFYAKELGTDIIKQVEQWLIKNKNGASVDKLFICKQIKNFAQRQGVNILDIVKNDKKQQK